jgi:Fe-coproporphyrin III synthase
MIRISKLYFGAEKIEEEAMTGDVWAPDPACYLTDEEIKG